MEKQQHRVLVVTHAPDRLPPLQSVLDPARIEIVESTPDIEPGPAGYSVVLLDGTSLVAEIGALIDTCHDLAPNTPVVLLLSEWHREIVSAAVRHGIFDVVIESTEIISQRLQAVIESACQTATLPPSRTAGKGDAPPYAQMVENAGDAIYAHDLQGRFTYLNRQAEALLGYTRDQLLHQPISSVLTTSPQTVIEHCLTKQRGGWESKFELTVRSRTGELIPVELTMAPVRHGARLVGFQGIARDIRARKEAQQLLEQRETRIQHLNLEIRKQKLRLEEASRIRSEFVANISHEFRTPLNGIIGYTDLLLERVYGPLNDNQISALDNIKTCATNLLRMIQEVLDLSKIKSNQLELERELCSPNDLIEATLGTIAPLARKKGLEVRTSPGDDLPLLYVDFQRIYEVFVNLAGNAVKFTSSGTVEIGAVADDERVTFYVRDTGIGIAPEIKELIFQEFRQGDSSRNRLYGGIGLGLSLSKRLIELHGGEITVDSDVNQGSTFSFTIPLACNRIVEAEREINAASRQNEVVRS